MDAKDIEGRIECLNRFSGAQLTADSMIGQGWRIGRKTTDSKGFAIDRYLSPRGTRKEIALWLDGFEEGIRHSEEIIK